MQYKYCESSRGRTFVNTFFKKIVRISSLSLFFTVFFCIFVLISEQRIWAFDGNKQDRNISFILIVTRFFKPIFNFIAWQNLGLCSLYKFTTGVTILNLCKCFYYVDFHKAFIVLFLLCRFSQSLYCTVFIMSIFTKPLLYCFYYVDFHKASIVLFLLCRFSQSLYCTVFSRLLSPRWQILWTY